jgi:hypothetical protein
MGMFRKKWFPGKLLFRDIPSCEALMELELNIEAQREPVYEAGPPIAVPETHVGYWVKRAEGRFSAAVRSPNDRACPSGHARSFGVSLRK